MQLSEMSSPAICCEYPETQYQAAQPLMWPDVTVSFGTTPLGARRGQYLTPLSLHWEKTFPSMEVHLQVAAPSGCCRFLCSALKLPLVVPAASLNSKPSPGKF